MEKLLNELSSENRPAYSVDSDVEIDAQIPENLKRSSGLGLPSITENDLSRHFTNLSRKNYALSTSFYPLGSCTMKYNPLINERVAKNEAFNFIHPYQPGKSMQGVLKIMYELEKDLCEISGMDCFSLQQAAGAHGEFTGLLIIAKYFKSIKQKRTKIIIPDTAHGTNPASAALAGFGTVSLKSESDGSILPEKLKKILTPEIAAVMLTVPNTLGAFEKNIPEISRIVHENGSLLYYDGANLNAVMGIVRPGDMGFDVMHINLHKTFSTPHGGGGPGSGPVGVKEFLEPFLPVPKIESRKSKFVLNYKKPKSIGKLKAFLGNFPVILKAYVYIKSLGAEGLKNVSEWAVLNANYMLARFKDKIDVPAGSRCMHEFVLSPKSLFKNNVKTLDVAKRLLDYGYYAPTIYFPLIVEEAVMLEPTETESKETMDAFIDTLIKIIYEEATQEPQKLKEAPFNTSVRRLNEVEAARNPVLKWKKA
ncbi:aminomethyl-transferring glycine dehydrogenase subunit GcvPB [Candidatus Endomicrobiellum trichonymphae]|uniref:Probable glycine dehydrogenase (decarboxylating) subunit 2 n=1 Tax=Endomicrobium trichonymphae TaxID=1408204 RepID=GCSPB_ENDTX|nr:aminomethyl-transferring glycine dehydrogenase subunit GcvPB [Candidatus Endomicrobium trichonymphae]B1GYV8.1 RecName: Full=Probable glycine dehydrogenase (decarboxylating) subunit 2; AltName: Full=Glycine cleavage system P-protein subunit 2; AltName: Full=Glycine decarboxylase subunit 2; AltName: Full=Glycine dehydrogenase (aminomethyl-transferring) subunit 2 [Candidatus Endomicrobium trichonymphae]BAG14201.1 glycine cleavage system P protein subunit 2 [Candidatus Endomicrobium trichonymphae]